MNNRIPKKKKKQKRDDAISFVANLMDYCRKNEKT